MPLLFYIDEPEQQAPAVSQLIGDDVSTDPTMLPGPDTPPPAQYPTSASAMNMSKRQRYWTFRSSMGETTFEMNSGLPALIRGWDNDAENQANYDVVGIQYVKDHLADEGVEKITIAPIVRQNAFDTDSEQQLSNQVQYKDHLSDEGVEIIILPPLAEIEELETAGNQIPTPDYFKDHLADETVEKITLNPPISRLFEWDTDGDHQFSNDYNLAEAQDPNDQTLLIFIPTQEIDNDSEQQFSTEKNVSSNEDPDDRVLRIFIPVPTTDENEIQNLPGVANLASDAGQEWTQFIIIPVFNPANVAQGTDAEQQLSNDSNINNIASNEGLFTNFIILNPLPPLTWGTDAENQIQQLPWDVDYQGWEYNESYKQIVFAILKLYGLNIKNVLSLVNQAHTVQSVGVFAVEEVNSFPALAVQSVRGE